MWAYRARKWQLIRDTSSRQYALKKYQVLLTRAREGMVVWILPGDPDDPTRPPRTYDLTTNDPARCGIENLP